MANNKQKTVIINTAQNKKTIKMLKMGGIIFGALIVIICFCYFLLGNVRISFAETKFSMTGLFVSETWNYEDVYEAYLTDDFDTGMMSFGTDTKDTINGIYNNNELGEYTIAAYRDQSQNSRFDKRSLGRNAEAPDTRANRQARRGMTNKDRIIE